METTWERANKWEVSWWGDCVNTADEEAKQIYYAEQMGIPKWKANTVGIVFDLHGKSVLDIGGGPVSLLLRSINRGRSVVVDPGKYPEWTKERYKAANIEYLQQKAEDLDIDFKFDEVWIYNVLQHVDNPSKVIEQAKRLGRIIRVFEWIDTEINIGHPHSLSSVFLDKSFGITGRIIKSPWGPATAEKAWTGISGEGEVTRMRFHLLGLAHTKTTKDYVLCAYTQKVYKMARMLTDLGHEVIHYGADGSDVPCEHVTVITDDVWKEAYGSYDWKKEFFKHDPNDLAYKTFNENAIREILARKKDGDFILSSFGNYQKPLTDAVNIPFTVEMGVGYSGVYAWYRVFESYAWMHYIYGLLKIGDGSWYDCVIPNSFNAEDFEFSAEKDDYYVYFGRLISRKGVQVAAQTCERLGKKLIVCGQGTLEEVGLENNKAVEFIGSVGVKERSDLMKRAKALFAPTYYIEPFGGVSVEAQFCGTPVITTDWGAFSETVQHGLTGYRCRTMDDFVFAASNTDKLLSPEEIRAKAVANYSVEKAALMYNEYFSKIVDLNKGGWYEMHPEKVELDWLRRY